MNFVDRLSSPPHSDRAESSAGADGPLDGAILDEGFYRALAKQLGVEFATTVDAHHLVQSEQECLELLRRANPLVSVCPNGSHARSTVLIGPNPRGLAGLDALRGRRDELKERFRVVPHFQLRTLLFTRAGSALTRWAKNGLAETLPECSARTILDTHQAIMLGMLLIALPQLLWLTPGDTLTGLRIVATVLFAGVTALRFTAAFSSNGPTPPHLGREFSDDEPVYSILVPLRHEAEIVPQLLTALSRIVWPRDKLEIKLICEADDRATIDAIRAHSLRDFVELIEVPPSLPATKPKALRYALPATMGKFIVLYDAEDVPHPLQLHEAWCRFKSVGPEVACLQAPLEIANGEASWIARMFAFEYAGLFRRLLPWLAAKHAVLPLGGTSSHFRREALEAVGAWDPHNVTEDADLGLRLARFGYRSETISLPTKEDAPETLAIWKPQRTRWCKGWIQTWLVHMRQPASLFGDLGPLSFGISQVLLFGIVFSALIHPVFLVTITLFIRSLLVGMALQPFEIWLFALDVFNIVCGYCGFLVLGWRALKPHERKGFWRVALATPLYWAAMSFAAWIALFELWRRPFHWAKTPHKPMRSLRTSLSV